MECLIKRTPFQKLIREISQEYRVCPDGPRTPSVQGKFSINSYSCSSRGSRKFYSWNFEDVNQLVVHAKRVTVMPRDIRLALRIRSDHYHWRITPEDAAQYERHHRRTEGGAACNFLG